MLSQEYDPDKDALEDLEESLRSVFRPVNNAVIDENIENLVCRVVGAAANYMIAKEVIHIATQTGDSVGPEVRDKDK